MCVELGANNGVTLSNTYHFEKRGWQHILVEPNPVLCKEIHLKRETGHPFSNAQHRGLTV